MQAGVLVGVGVELGGEVGVLMTCVGVREGVRVAVGVRDAVLDGVGVLDGV
jgi:hypothetical protein